MDIVLENICKSYDGKKVLEDVTRTFKGGDINYIQGPSGCGKSTMLSIIAGLASPDSGTVTGIQGRSMAIAFQEPRLLPWMSVLDNVMLALPLSMSHQERLVQARKWLEAVELQDSENAWPSTLSGGMAQRAGLARALALESDIILLDEPFSALDSALKERLFARLSSFWREHGTTVIMVTHDTI